MSERTTRPFSPTLFRHAGFARSPVPARDIERVPSGLVRLAQRECLPQPMNANHIRCITSYFVRAESKDAAHAPRLLGPGHFLEAKSVVRIGHRVR